MSLQIIWHKQRWQRQIWLTILLTCLLAAILISLSSGSYQIGLTDWWQGLSETQQQVIWQLRLPRTLLAIAVGGGLALCGAVLQILLHNPVAEPGLIGISSGASLLAVLLIFAGHQWGIIIPAWGISVSAFVGALIVTLLLLRLSQRGQMGGSRLLLLGVAIGIASNALITWLLYFSDDQALQAMALAFTHLRIVLEPGGPVALAAALFGDGLPDTVIAVATGGNVDPATFATALDRFA